MKTGSLYQIKKLYCLLYPSKDVTAFAATSTPSVIDAANWTAYWSSELNCRVCCVEPNSIFCLLEQDEKYCKVLTTNGDLGWIYLNEWCMGCVVEANENS